MSKSLKIENIKVRVTDPNLGAGGQGRAEKSALVHDPNVESVAKYLPQSPENAKRVKALVDKQLPMASPYLATLVASSSTGP